MSKLETSLKLVFKADPHNDQWCELTEDSPDELWIEDLHYPDGPTELLRTSLWKPKNTLRVCPSRVGRATRQLYQVVNMSVALAFERSCVLVHRLLFYIHRFSVLSLCCVVTRMPLHAGTPLEFVQLFRRQVPTSRFNSRRQQILAGTIARWMSKRELCVNH